MTSMRERLLFILKYIQEDGYASNDMAAAGYVVCNYHNWENKLVYEAIEFLNECKIELLK